MKDPLENAMLIQIWEMATYFLCDLSQHCCCSLAGWRALICTEPPAWLLLEWALSAADCWNGPVSSDCLFSFLYIPVLLPSFSRWIFFSFLLRGSSEVRGAVWPCCQEAALPAVSQPQAPAFLPWQGWGFFFFKKKKKQNKNHLFFLACCLLGFFFSDLKVREKKAKCIFVCWQSQDWTFNSSFIHHC